MSNNDDYKQGMRDSQNGIPARDDASDEYIEGYGCIDECADMPMFSVENFDATWAAIA